VADIIYTFSGRDYTTELERLTALLQAELSEYTDLNHSDAGIVILRLLARETDQLNEYIDRVFNEGFIATAQFKQSLVDLGRCVDYLPVLAAAASTTLQFTRQAGKTGSITIPQYSSFSRSDGVSYLTAAGLTMAADEQTGTVDAIQGTVVTYDFVEADFDIPDWSKRPRVSLGKSVAAGTVEVWHGGGPTSWINIDSFWRTASTDLHFVLELNGDDDTVWLVLGDGVEGANYPTSETLHVRFVRTDEAAGNCGSGTIYLVPESLSDAITCTNIESATGGGSAESTTSIRRNIPRRTAIQRRAVISEDYEALVEGVAGVLHCQALDRNDVTPALNLAYFGSEEGGWPHRYQVLVVVPNDGGPMSTPLKDDIWAACAAKGHLGPWSERYLLFDAIEVPLNVTVRIGVLTGYSTQTVSNNVSTAIANVLAPANRAIGETLEFSELCRAVTGVAGVAWEDFTTPEEDVTLEKGQIHTAGTITVTVG